MGPNESKSNTAEWIETENQNRIPRNPDATTILGRVKVNRNQQGRRYILDQITGPRKPARLRSGQRRILETPKSFEGTRKAEGTHTSKRKYLYISVDTLHGSKDEK